MSRLLPSPGDETERGIPLKRPHILQPEAGGGLIHHAAIQAKGLFNRTIKSKILQDSSVILVANVIGTLAGLMVSVILGRALGPAGYGLLALTVTLINTLIQFIDTRGSEAVIRFMTAEVALNNPRKALGFLYMGISNDALLALVSLGAAWLVVPSIVSKYPDNNALQPLVTTYTLVIPFTFLEQSISTVAHTFKRFRLSAATNLFDSVARLAAVLLSAHTGPGGVIWAYVATSGLGFAMSASVGLYLLIRNFGSLRAEGYWQAWRAFLPFSFFTSALASMQTLSVNADTLLMGILSHTSQISFFNIGKSATSFLSLPTAPVTTVLFPSLSEAFARKDLTRVKYLIYRFMLLSAATSVAGAVALFLLADWLVHLLYGPGFEPVVNVLQVLLIGAVLESVFRWIRPLTVAAGKPQAILLPATFLTLVRILILVPLLYLYGALGAAITYDIIVGFNVLTGIILVLPRLGWRVLSAAATDPPSGANTNIT